MKKTLVPVVSPVADNQLANPQTLITSKEGTLVLLALLEGLSFNVLSGDVWYLSMIAAANIAVKKYGIDPDVTNEILLKALDVAQSKGKTNPMSSMF